MRVRIGSHKYMQDECSEGVKRELLRYTHPEFERVFDFFIRQLDILIDKANRDCDHFIRDIKFRAKNKGYEIKDYGESCDAERCNTCLGKYPQHYPYFKIKKPKALRGYLPVEKVKPFLREIGFTDEEIADRFSTFNARIVLLNLRNGNVRGLNWLGLTRMTLKIKEVSEVE